MWFNLHGEEHDIAACNLSSLPDFSTFELGTCFEVLAETSCASLNVDASGHAVHGMNKNVRFWGACSVICSCLLGGHSEPL